MFNIGPFMTNCAYHTSSLIVRRFKRINKDPAPVLINRHTTHVLIYQQFRSVCNMPVCLLKPICAPFLQLNMFSVKKQNNNNKKLSIVFLKKIIVFFPPLTKDRLSKDSFPMKLCKLVRIKSIRHFILLFNVSEVMTDYDYPRPAYI